MLLESGPVGKPERLISPAAALQVEPFIIGIIVIIIITRPRPAFGQLGLSRSSGGKTSGGVSTPRFAPSALSLALKQYI